MPSAFLFNPFGAGKALLNDEMRMPDLGLWTVAVVGSVDEAMLGRLGFGFGFGLAMVGFGCGLLIRPSSPPIELRTLRKLIVDLCEAEFRYKCRSVVW